MLGRKGFEGAAVLVAHVFHMAQPQVHQTHPLIVHHGLHATAAIVAHDHDVLDPQRIHGELDDRLAIEVGMHHHIGDIAMDENLAGQESHDLVGRHAGIGTTDPQIFRTLQVGQSREEIRIGGSCFRSPTGVGGKQFRQVFHVEVIP